MSEIKAHSNKTETTINQKIMKIATVIARVMLGLVFFVFGLNKFLNFIHMPPPSGEAGAFFGALYVTHYLYVIATCEIVGGLLLLSGRYVALGLTFVGPVVVNILAFTIFMSHTGWPPAALVVVLSLFLLWRYRENFAGLVKDTPARKTPRAQQIAAQTATVN
jgi:putative oxidoreductase